MSNRFTTISGMLILAAALSLSSCKKDDNNSTEPDSDSTCAGCEKILALATYDAVQQGIYKGLLLTGTGVGHFRVNIKNNDEQTFMVMKYTREKEPVLNDTLKPTSVVNTNAGATVNITVLGAASRTTVYVDATGGNPYVGNFVLSGSIGTGPKPEAQVLKETSGSQVKVFEGDTKDATVGGVNGRVGFVVQGNKILGLIATGAGLKEGFNGTIAADKTFSFSFSGNNSVFSGSIKSATEISGEYSIGGTKMGTFSATRTL